MHAVSAMAVVSATVHLRWRLDGVTAGEAAAELATDDEADGPSSPLPKSSQVGMLSTVVVSGSV